MNLYLSFIVDENLDSMICLFIRYFDVLYTCFFNVIRNSCDSDTARLFIANLVASLQNSLFSKFRCIVFGKFFAYGKLSFLIAPNVSCARREQHLEEASMINGKKYFMYSMVHDSDQCKPNVLFIEVMTRRPGLYLDEWSPSNIGLYKPNPHSSMLSLNCN